VLRGRETEMEYDNTNRGALFRNEEKDPNDEKDRDYAGVINIEGAEYWLSGWVRVSKNGRKYLSLSLKPKQEKPAESEKKSPAEDFGDDIPFYEPAWRPTKTGCS